MKPLAFAWRSLTRQPARALLAIAGVAVVGALLFDMLLLSGGLALSFRELLDGVGFDVRVSASKWMSSRSVEIDDAAATLERLASLPEIEEVALLRYGRAHVVKPNGRYFPSNFMGLLGPSRRIWTLLDGDDLPRQGDPRRPVILINRTLADRMQVAVGDGLRVRGRCEAKLRAMPVTEFTVVGIVEFQFESEGDLASVTALDHFLRACQPQNRDAATMFVVASRPEAGPEAAVRAIRAALPELHAFTNREFVDRTQVTDFSYFRQISFALSSITLFFTFLLIATLLTVSVNQRLGEVATLRALGFRRGRVVADLICESALLVGCGGALALPLGLLLAARLDHILRQMPGIPTKLRFFVFQPEVVVQYGALLAVAGVLAAAYPVYLAARLPITKTLRREVVS